MGVIGLLCGHYGTTPPLLSRASEKGTNVWIAKRTDYGARVLLALAIDDRQLSLPELAERTAVPTSVLEQVMPRLRSDGLVRSERGRKGGYRLNKPPEDITLEHVVRLFQGPLAPIECATRTNPEPCDMEDGCSMRDIWADVRDATITILAATTFQALADRASGTWLPPGASPLPIAPTPT
jgi:Rrf2 family protein